MVEIPIILKLRKQSHKDLARVQDILVRELYKFFENAVFHGGTAIWRCYRGDRFSEDVDVYIKRDISKLNSLFDKLEEKGFSVKKKKIGTNSLYSKLEFERVILRFEALFKEIEGNLSEYETSEGNILTVYSLTPEELIKEKVNAYLNRLKIRDLYDIFFLLRYVQKRQRVDKELKRLVNNFKNPIDEKELKVLVFEGPVPSSEKMIDYIKRW